MAGDERKLIDAFLASTDRGTSEGKAIGPTPKDNGVYSLRANKRERRTLPAPTTKYGKYVTPPPNTAGRDPRRIREEERVRREGTERTVRREIQTQMGDVEMDGHGEVEAEVQD